MKKIIYLTLSYITLNSTYALEQIKCNQLSQKAEALSAQGKRADALEMADKVVQSCNPATYNAVILAGKLTLNYENNPKASLVYFMKAIKQGPNFYMGYLNASAAYMGMEEFDKSIEYAKLSIEKAETDEDRRKGKYNLALAFYKKAASNGDDKELYKAGYELFGETIKSKQFKASSHFFMAVYEESLLYDESKARPNYQKACDNGHKQSCSKLQGLTARLAPFINKKNYKPASDYESLDIDALAKEMKKCYKAKYNMEDSAIESVVTSITSSFATMDAVQKKKMYIQTLKSMSCTTI